MRQITSIWMKPCDTLQTRIFLLKTENFAPALISQNANLPTKPVVTGSSTETEISPRKILRHSSSYEHSTQTRTGTSQESHMTRSRRSKQIEIPSTKLSLRKNEQSTENMDSLKQLSLLQSEQPSDDSHMGSRALYRICIHR